MNEDIYERTRAILSQRRNSAISENDRRIDEINAKIPEIREINEALFNTGKELIRAVTMHEGGDVQARRRQTRIAQELRTATLPTTLTCISPVRSATTRAAEVLRSATASGRSTASSWLIRSIQTLSSGFHRSIRSVSATTAARSTRQ